MKSLFQCLVVAAEPVIEEGEEDEEIAKAMVEGVEVEGVEGVETVRVEVEGEVGGIVVGIVVGEIVGEGYIVVEVNLGASEEVVGEIVEGEIVEGEIVEAEGEAEEGQLISLGIFPKPMSLYESNFPILTSYCRPPGSTGAPPPSAEVRRVEDGIIASQKGLSLSKLSLTNDTISLPPRPGYATQGTPIILRTNYFHFKSTAQLPLYRYNVEIVPDEKQKRKRRRIFQLLWDTPLFANIRHLVTSDSGSTIISASLIDLPGDRGRINVTYYDADQAGPGANPTVYIVAIQKTRTITVEELLSYLCNTGPAAVLDAKEEIVQALNIVMAKRVNEDARIVAHGQNKYFVLENNPMSLSGGLVALRGYYSSIRTSNARILLNLNACTSAFYSSVPLWRVMSEFLGGTAPRPGGAWDRLAIRKLQSFLKLLKVETSYLVRDGVRLVRVKVIKGLNGGRGAREVTFDSETTGRTNVEAWFRRQHNITIQYPLLPVVNIGSNERAVYVPAEVCTVVKGQPFRGPLNENQTRSMIDIACRLPAENARFITGEGCEVVGIAGGQQQQAWLGAFGITVDPNMLTVDGRILAAPSVLYHGNKVVNARNGSWNMAQTRFTIGANLVSWACLRFMIPGDRRDPIGENLSRYLDEFTQVLRDCGINPGVRHASLQCPLVPLGPSAEAQNEQIIKNGLGHFANKMGDQKPKILLVVIPNTDKFVYSKIKYFGDTQVGIHTVCVVASKFAKDRNTQYHANVALKFNLKRGGVNQILQPDKLGPVLRDGKTMLVGIDVTHPSPGSAKGSPSIAGVVASIDGHYAQWPASVVLQESKKEMVTCLEEIMVERLRLWSKKNSNNLPTRIIIYRDGVSEAQYQDILKKELPPIRDAITKVYGTRPKAKLTIVVVGKRHHTRFYPVNEEGADHKGNPRNGTVVDRGITGVRQWDFYLQAHAGLQGTTRPAHYVVVLDEIGLGADGMEQMTHNLCYLFGRATKSVSICPPAYYADLLCERGRCYIHGLLTDGSSTGQETPEANFARAQQTWGSGVAQALRESMFYI